jgi:hypothetical protein
MPILPILLAIALAVALPAAGCGGDDGDGSGEAASPAAAGAGGETGSAEGSTGGGDADAGEPEADADPEADAPVETAELSKSEFVAQADRACAGAKKATLSRISQAGREREGESAPTFEDVAAEALVSGVSRQADAIRDLGAPSGDEERIEALLAEMEAAQGALEDNPPANIGAYVKALQRAGELARKYGLAQCASSTLF